MKTRLIFILTGCAMLVSVLIGFAYTSTQQVLRQSANDPQIQIVEDVADSLAQGMPVSQLAPQGGLIDISKSLSPFLVVMDEKGTVLQSSATLDGSSPKLPQSVLDYVKAHGEDRLTWEPKTGVRIASVTVHYTAKDGTSGYVLIGRSLREIEKREQQLMQQAIAAWLVSMAILLITGFALAKHRPPQPAA